MTDIAFETSGAVGDGIATVTSDGTVLDTWFPAPRLDATATSGTRRLSPTEAKASLGIQAELGKDEARGVESPARAQGSNSTPPCMPTTEHTYAFADR